MSYQALYRVWRPQSFDELVGQDLIAQTLKNAISNHQLSHAYLFAGPRGTGKTSAAKILSKAVNCPHNNHGNPCNECEICRGITASEVSDVIEIDAASNNGVDEIRDLRDKVRYAPTQAENKVYIIDEVHMLTTGAFNALLKTLEEPPEHVVFILATTEPHKIPATILSRTQRFDFQRIQDQDLISRMQHILEFDGKAYDQEALKVIARAANGGMRDALSLLDQALSFQAEGLTVETALQVSGSFAQVVYVDYLIALANQKTDQALQILSEQLKEGKQAARFIEELILFARDTLLSHFSSRNHTLLTDQELEKLKEAVPVDFYYQLIDALNRAQNQMRFSTQPEVYLEVMTVQLSLGKMEQPTVEATNPMLEAQIKSLQNEIARQKTLLETLLKQSKLDQTQEKTLATDNQQEKKQDQELVPRQRPVFAQTSYQLDLHDTYRVLNHATKEGISQLKAKWDRILSDLSPQQRMKFMNTQPLAGGSDYGLIAFEDDKLCGMVQADPQLIAQVNHIASHYLGQTINLTYMAQADWLTVRKNYKILFDRNGRQPIDLPEKLPSQAAQSQAVASAQAQLSQADQPKDLVERKETEIASPVRTPESIEGHLEKDRQVAQLFAKSQANMIEENSYTAEEEIIQAEGQTGFFDLDDRSDLLEEANNDVMNQPVVSKAVELFGKENVTIFEER